MVAPSFQAMTILSEPYTKNGKSYIDVRNEKTKTIRSVRWYDDKEYARAYGKATKATPTLTPEQKKFYKPAGLRSLEVIEGEQTLIKAKIACDPRIGFVELWKAYGAYLQDKQRS